MYYGKQNSVNSDYYNSYRDSSYQYNNGKNYLTLILKILLILLLLGVLLIGFIFISNQIKTAETIPQIVQKETTIKVKEESISKSKIEELPPKIETEKRSDATPLTQVNLTQDDIANIVAIVMHKLNAKSNQKDSNIGDDDYTKELLLQDVDKLSRDNLVAVDNINVKKVAKDDIKNSKSNHYNKVVINRPQEEQYTNDTLARLSIELSAINEDSDISTNYTREISKEIEVRSNEMRVIVVKEGDTLSKIAKRAYGSYDDYVKIFEANPEIIKNPDQIYVGQKLRIPI